jgi:hypothetical protein
MEHPHYTANREEVKNPSAPTVLDTFKALADSVIRKPKKISHILQTGLLDRIEIFWN